MNVGETAYLQVRAGRRWNDSGTNVGPVKSTTMRPRDLALFVMASQSDRQWRVRRAMTFTVEQLRRLLALGLAGTRRRKPSVIALQRGRGPLSRAPSGSCRR